MHYVQDPAGLPGRQVYLAAPEKVDKQGCSLQLVLNEYRLYFCHPKPGEDPSS